MTFTVRFLDGDRQITMVVVNNTKLASQAVYEAIIRADLTEWCDAEERNILIECR